MDSHNSQSSSAAGGAARTLALVFGAAAAAAATAYYWLLRRPLPRCRGELRLSGLHGEVEVRRDRWGIPHIYAGSEHDLMYAQGFVHAQDRLWQMEFQRRLAAGRLAEVVGEVALPVDRWIRILGLRRAGEQELTVIQPAIMANLEAFATGVNARIDQGRLPLEFSLLRYRPEPWTPADTLSWIKMMSWSLSVNWESEWLRSQLIARLGPERAAQLEPEHLGRWPTIIPPGVDYGAIGQQAMSRAEAARRFMGPPAHAGLGSNNWAVSGEHCANGRPLLANDMHLPLSIPCIWYENHLEADAWRMTGVSLPGLPGIVSGHNGCVAWGLTNGYSDVQDLYLERLRRADDGRVQYEFQGDWLDAEVINEEIRVKGGGTVVEEVVITRHGPILSGLEGQKQPLALRWTSLEPEGTMNSLHGLTRARNCGEFQESLRSWSSPTQNFVYADIEGNIAFTHAGKIPIRAKGDGRLPVPGWTGEYEWIGYIPFEGLPHLWNPPQGWIGTANNQVVADDFPYDLGMDHVIGDRAQRIQELLSEQDQVDIAYIRQMQFDLQSPTARVFQRYLGQLPVEDPRLRQVLEMMGQWDGRLAADSREAAVYQVFVRHMLTLCLKEKLGDLAIRYLGKGPIPGVAEGSMWGITAWAWLETLLAEPESPWFDLGGGEDRDTVMRLALQQSVDYLSAEFGPDPAGWSWGKLHTLTYTHPLGQVKPLDKLFNRGPFPLGGDGTTLWQSFTTTYDLSNQFVIGPPFRFIADMGDLSRSLGLLTPGQSGQVGSKHYDDQMAAWTSGEYHPMLWRREEVEQETQDRLRLRPL